MRPILPLSILLIALGTAPAFAAGPCTGFKWDVSKELALFNGPSVALSAAKNAAAAPTIGADRFYQLQLLPQAEVAFAVTPARSTATDGAYAGLVNLKLDAPGSYRIAVDAPMWIDVAVNGKLATAADFQGQQSCDGPHKIVEFDLSGGRQFILQISGSAKTTIRLTVTQPPPRKL
ncbi:MAG: hypothetical protein ABSG18_10445 [Steroidobacteraceae bacterium]|jgi:hypothetical protein